MKNKKEEKGGRKKKKKEEKFNEMKKCHLFYLFIGVLPRGERRTGMIIHRVLHGRLRRDRCRRAHVPAPPDTSLGCI